MQENHNGEEADEYIVAEKWLAGVCMHPCSHIYLPRAHRGHERVLIEALRLYAERIVQVLKENAKVALHSGTFLTFTDILQQQAVESICSNAGTSNRVCVQICDLSLSGCQKISDALAKTGYI